MRVFLTGASGSVGSGVLESLIADGRFDIDCLARSDRAASVIESRGGRVVRGDMADTALFEKLRTEAEYTFIVHAAQASYRDETVASVDDLERDAVLNLEMLCGSETRLMIFTSGVWMYGNGGMGRPITEKTALEPFELSRRRVALLRELSTHTDVPWAQLCPPSLVYGSFGGFTHIVKTLQGGGSINVLDDESLLWSVVERLDLGRAYVALLDYGVPGDNFVVAEDEPVPNVELFETIRKAVGSGRIVRRTAEEMGSIHGPDWLEVAQGSQPVDSTLFKSRTGWRARERFATSVYRLVSV